MTLPPRRRQTTELLIDAQRLPVLGALARTVALLLGIDFPREVVYGVDLRIYHHGRGIVVHPLTRFGNRCRLFHGVTIGRSDPFVPESDSKLEMIEVGDDVWLCAGAVILARTDTLRIGNGTIVGANAVLLSSTGEWEVWAGNPAKRVGCRRPEMGGPT